MRFCLGKRILLVVVSAALMSMNRSPLHAQGETSARSAPCIPACAWTAPDQTPLLEERTLAPNIRVRARRQARSGTSAFLVEAFGGTLGSAAGFGLGVLITDPEDCGEDLACTLEAVGVALGISAGGAGLGTTLLGNVANTEPSVLGAFLGGLVGIPAGVGVVHLLSEELNIARGDAVLWLSYTITQGLVTAIGSRLGAAIRD